MLLRSTVLNPLEAFATIFAAECHLCLTDIIASSEAGDRVLRACLVIQPVLSRAAAGGGHGKGGADPGLIPLTVPEIRRLVMAMGGPGEQRAFRFGWSQWRRAHRAVAARCHVARRAVRQPGGCPVHVAQSLPWLHRAVSDAEWERIRLLLPSQKPAIGRLRHDHRTVLNGILAVVGTDRSSREMPQTFGHWAAAYKRYRLWCAEGLWPRIIAALAGATYEVSL